MRKRNKKVSTGDALPGATDIPPFLRINAERRKEAWKEFDARRKEDVVTSSSHRLSLSELKRGKR